VYLNKAIMDQQYQQSVLLQRVNFTTDSQEKEREKCAVAFFFFCSFDVLIIGQFSDFIPTVSNEEPSSKSKSKTGLIVGVVVAVIASGLLIVLAVFVWIYKIKKKETDEGTMSMINMDVAFTIASLSIFSCNRSILFC
jgi:hypothetical protein